MAAIIVRTRIEFTGCKKPSTKNTVALSGMLTKILVIIDESFFLSIRGLAQAPMKYPYSSTREISDRTGIYKTLKTSMKLKDI